MAKSLKKIAVIGNGGGGKTTLSRKIAVRHSLTLIHVDSIQYLSGMKVRPIEETSTILNKIANSESWLIDGFGSLEVMEKRFKAADLVVFIDFPIWRHYWWCTKRQVMSYWRPRSELPFGCSEVGIIRTIKLYKTLWRVHTQIRPRLLQIFALPEISSNIMHIKKLSEWEALYRAGP